MTTGEIVLLVILFLIALLSLVISVLHFMQKGYLLNNAYILATEQDRKNMDLKSYYRQSGFVFLMIFFIVMLMGLNLLTGKLIYILVEIALVLLMMVYAIASSIKIQKNSK